MYAAAYRQRARRSGGNRERLRRLRRGATGTKAAPAVGERTRALLAADSVPSQNWDWRFNLVVSGRLASPKDKSVPALSKGPQPISTRSSDGGTDLPTALDRRPLVHFEGPSEGDRARPIRLETSDEGSVRSLRPLGRAQAHTLVIPSAWRTKRRREKRLSGT